MTRQLTPPDEYFDYRLQSVWRVVDGDTLDAELDLGLHLKYTHRFRLLAVNTPERGQDLFEEATEFVRDWFARQASFRLRVRTYKSDSFGRWLAYIYNPVTLEDLSFALVMAGYNVPSRKRAAVSQDAPKELLYTRP